MTHKYPCLESITALACAPEYWTIRVWREETELAEKYDQRDLFAAVQVFLHRKDADGNPEPVRKKVVLAEMLAALPRVNAVEVKDDHGNGLVVYVNWP